MDADTIYRRFFLGAIILVLTAGAAILGTALTAISEHLADVARSHPPFEMHLSGTGTEGVASSNNPKSLF